MQGAADQRVRILAETTQAREKAESLLAGLLDARTASERRLASLSQSDLLKQVTGRSSMDNAIESTRRIIDSLGRTIEQFKRDLSAEDLALLDEAMASMRNGG